MVGRVKTLLAGTSEQTQQCDAASPTDAKLQTDAGASLCWGLGGWQRKPKCVARIGCDE